MSLCSLETLPLARANIVDFTQWVCIRLSFAQPQLEWDIMIFFFLKKQQQLSLLKFYFTCNSRYPLYTLKGRHKTLRRPYYSFIKAPLREKNTSHIFIYKLLDFPLIQSLLNQLSLLKPLEFLRSLAVKVLVLKNEIVRDESLRRASKVWGYFHWVRVQVDY